MAVVRRLAVPEQPSHRDQPDAVNDALSKTVRPRLPFTCSLKVRRSVRSLMVAWMGMGVLPMCSVNGKRKLHILGNRKSHTSSAASFPETRCWGCRTRCSCGNRVDAATAKSLAAATRLSRRAAATIAASVLAGGHDAPLLRRRFELACRRFW